MPAATLIVNPASGRARLLAARLPAIQALLGRHGYTTSILSTTGQPDSASSLAASAAACSALILACGGDGTAHGVIQGLAGTGVFMGVVPLGTHNALAASLGLPADPLAAVELLLPLQPRLLPLGQVVTEHQTGFFITMAGCGPSGALAQALAVHSRQKARFGRAVYPLQAARLLATRRWPTFQVDFRLPGATAWQSATAAALLVSRVPSLGGLFGRLTPGSSMESPTLRAYLLGGPLQLSLPAWFATSLTGLRNPWLRTVEAEELRCTPSGAREVLVQADAEPYGVLPCTLRMAPAALNLLMPGTMPRGRESVSVPGREKPKARTSNGKSQYGDASLGSE